MDRFSRFLAVGCLGFALLLPGCGKQEMPAATMEATDNIRKLGQLLAGLASSKRGKMPKDEAELRKLLKAKKLSDDEIEKMLVSPRDSQPYYIPYGKTIKNPDITLNEPWPLLACEKTGKDGKRYTVSLAGGVTDMAEEDIKSLLPGFQ